jgi:hypothetical protein
MADSIPSVRVMVLARRDVLKASAATMALLTASCGYILYPERKGRSGGSIDTGPFIVDLLWLLPGIIPGVICLAVDFSTGCIYKNSHVAQRAPRDEPLPQGLLARAEVAIDGASVAKSESDIDRRGRLRLVWERDVDPDAVRSRGQLIFKRNTGGTALAQVRDLLAT